MKMASPLYANPSRNGIIEGQQFTFGGRHQVANDGIIIVRDDDAADYPEEMYLPEADQLHQQGSNDGVDDGIGQDHTGCYENGTTSGADGSDEPLALDDYQPQDSMGSSGCGSADGKSSRASIHPPRSNTASTSPAQQTSAAGPIRNGSANPALPNKRWNGQRWNDNETRTLIELFGKYPNLVGRRLWETIGEGLRARGFQRTDSQAREKWRDVYTFYKRQLESYQKTGDFPDAPFFKQLHAIYSKREPPSSTGSWGRSPASAAGITRASPMELSRGMTSMQAPSNVPVAHQKTPELKKEMSSPQVPQTRSSPLVASSSNGTLNLSQQSVISSTQRHNSFNNVASSQQQHQSSNGLLNQIKRQHEATSIPPPITSSSSNQYQTSSTHVQRQTELLERIVKMQEQQLRMQNQLLQLERKRVANESKQTEYLGRLVAMLGDLDDIDGGDEMFVGDNSGEQIN